MPGYVYGGNQFDAHLPYEPPKRKRAYPRLRNPAVCGTSGGYKKHRREQTPICEACRAAVRILDRARKQRNREAV